MGALLVGLFLHNASAFRQFNYEYGSSQVTGRYRKRIEVWSMVSGKLYIPISLLLLLGGLLFYKIAPESRVGLLSLFSSEDTAPFSVTVPMEEFRGDYSQFEEDYLELGKTSSPPPRSSYYIYRTSRQVFEALSNEGLLSLKQLKARLRSLSLGSASLDEDTEASSIFIRTQRAVNYLLESRHLLGAQGLYESGEPEKREATLRLWASSLPSIDWLLQRPQATLGTIPKHGRRAWRAWRKERLKEYNEFRAISNAFFDYAVATKVPAKVGGLAGSFLHSYASDDFHCSRVRGLHDENFVLYEGPRKENLDKFIEAVDQNKTHLLVLIVQVKKEKNVPPYFEERLGKVRPAAEGQIHFKNHEEPIDFIKYDSWKDHTVIEPEELLALCTKINAMAAAAHPEQTVAIHCHAGVGRSGTVSSGCIILNEIDAQLARGVPIDEVSVNIAEIVGRLRLVRAHCVNPKQYVLLYDLMRSYLEQKKSALSASAASVN